MGRIREIVNAGYGCLVIHHHGKALSALELRARGSSDIIGITDVEYALYKDKDKDLVLQSVKSRRAPIAPVKLRIEEIENELLISCLGTAQEQKTQISDDIVEYLSENEVGKNDLVDWLANCGRGMSEKTVRGYINDLLAKGRIEVKTGRYNRKLYSAK